MNTRTDNKKFRLLTAALAVPLFCLANVTNAGVTVHKNVSSISEFEAQVEKYQQTENSGKVLLVYDIDDTLLESSSFFGGDVWFNWQNGRSITNKSGNQTTISEQDKLSCLYNKLGVFYALGNFHLVEPNTAEVFNRLKNKHDTMMLTSRSPDYRAGTEEELVESGISFSDASLLPKDFALYYKLNDGRSTRDVSYANGIVMSTGLNKGVVLQDLLSRLNKSYSAIFFIDDGMKNVTNVQSAWQSSDTEVHAFHYTHVPKVISDTNIEQSRKAQASLNEFISVAFPSRAEEFTKGQCRP